MRTRVIKRAGEVCQSCGRNSPSALVVGHRIGRADGLAMGLGDADLDGEDNLIGQCPGCNEAQRRAEVMRGQARRRAALAPKPRPHPGLIN